MIFHSLTYLVFLALLLALYWSLPRRGQNFLLVIASYIFYGWNIRGFSLPLWASTLVDSWRKERRCFSAPRPRENQSLRVARRKVFGGVLRLRFYAPA